MLRASGEKTWPSVHGEVALACSRSNLTRKLSKEIDVTNVTIEIGVLLEIKRHFDALLGRGVAGIDHNSTGERLLAAVVPVVV